MTIDEMTKGYEKEVAYQKHMLKNLGYWFQLCTILSGVGIVLIYFFHGKTLWLNIVGIVLLVLGALGMLMFGYSGWKGQQNVRAVVDDYDKKIKYFQKKVRQQPGITPKVKQLLLRVTLIAGASFISDKYNYGRTEKSMRFSSHNFFGVAQCGGRTNSGD